MSSKKQMGPNDEIDLREVILALWREKFLITFFTLIFTLAGYIYGIQQPQIYEARVNMPTEKVSDIEFILEKYGLVDEKKSFALDIHQDFKLYLSEQDNFIKFLKQNEKFDNFKSYMKKNNFSFNDLVKIEPLVSDNRNPTHVYLFNYLESFPLSDFLSDYLIYAKQVTEIKLKKKLIRKINHKIETYKSNLGIANSIDLQDPISLFSTTSNHSTLFFRGSKVLAIQIGQLEQQLNKLKSDTILLYPTILPEVTIATLISKPVYMFMVIAFIIGLFFSVIIIFVKSMFSK